MKPTIQFSKLLALDELLLIYFKMRTFNKKKIQEVFGI
jgi:hypothetical protein